MTDLQAQAKQYAKDAILRLREYLITTEDKVEEAIAEAYEHGYIEGDTKDEKPETLIAPDCRYFSEGYCSKGLPGTFCELIGCVAHYPKENADNR